MPTNRSAITAALLPIAAGISAGTLLTIDPRPTVPAIEQIPPAVVAEAAGSAPTIAATIAVATPPVAQATPDVEEPATTTSEPPRVVADATTPDRPPQPVSESSFVEDPRGEPDPGVGPHRCVDADPIDALPAVFDSGLPLVGADYQRAFPLPDGRVLWLFQDAFVDTPNGRTLVHNVGLLQSGRCFQLLHDGTGTSPAPYVFADLTEPHRRWFWPLGGDIGADGQLHVFVAEMHEHSDRYLGHVEPVVTWLVTIDTVTLEVVDRRPAPNPSADLYGWSVVSHGEHTYLYSHCYRQFGWDPFPFSESASRFHDWDCTADVTVARIARGRFDQQPEYWDGAYWATDAEGAVAVIPTEGRAVNPTQVAVVDDTFVAVTLADDWWGDTVHLDVAPTAHGPWTTYDTVTVDPVCAECNTYFASIVPFGATDTSISVAVSNNHWDGDVMAHYRSTVIDVPTPPQ